MNCDTSDQHRWYGKKAEYQHPALYCRKARDPVDLALGVLVESPDLRVSRVWGSISLCIGAFLIFVWAALAKAGLI